MNDTFNLKRFGWLLKKTLLERPLQLVGLIGLTLIVTLLFYAIVKGMINFEVAQNGAFIIGLVCGGTFLASFVFGYFSSNASGSSFLTLPASAFEKWLCSVLMTGVLFPIIFLAFFRVLDATLVRMFHDSLDPAGPFYKEMYESVNIFPYDGFVASKSYMMFVNFTTTMLVGSLYFNKAPFIKVALLFTSIFIVGSYLNYIIASAIFHNLDKALPYYSVFISVGKEYGKIVLPAYAANAIDIGILYVMPTVLLATTYIRLREKEF